MFIRDRFLCEQGIAGGQSERRGGRFAPCAHATARFALVSAHARQQYDERPAAARIQAAVSAGGPPAAVCAAAVPTAGPAIRQPQQQAAPQQQYAQPQYQQQAPQYAQPQQQAAPQQQYAQPQYQQQSQQYAQPPRQPQYQQQGAPGNAADKELPTFVQRLFKKK